MYKVLLVFCFGAPIFERCLAGAESNKIRRESRTDNLAKKIAALEGFWKSLPDASKELSKWPGAGGATGQIKSFLPPGGNVVPTWPPSSDEAQAASANATLIQRLARASLSRNKVQEMMSQKADEHINPPEQTWLMAEKEEGEGGVLERQKQRERIAIGIQAEELQQKNLPSRQRPSSDSASAPQSLSRPPSPLSSPPASVSHRQSFSVLQESNVLSTQPPFPSVTSSSQLFPAQPPLTPQASQRNEAENQDRIAGFMAQVKANEGMNGYVAELVLAAQRLKQRVSQNQPSPEPANTQRPPSPLQTDVFSASLSPSASASQLRRTTSSTSLPRLDSARSAPILQSSSPESSGGSITRSYSYPNLNNNQQNTNTQFPPQALQQRSDSRDSLPPTTLLSTTPLSPASPSSAALVPPVAPTSPSQIPLPVSPLLPSPSALSANGSATNVVTANPSGKPTVGSFLRRLDDGKLHQTPPNSINQTDSNSQQQAASSSFSNRRLDSTATRNSVPTRSPLPEGFLSSQPSANSLPAVSSLLSSTQLPSSVGKKFSLQETRSRILQRKAQQNLQASESSTLPPPPSLSALPVRGVAAINDRSIAPAPTADQVSLWAPIQSTAAFKQHNQAINNHLPVSSTSSQTKQDGTMQEIDALLNGLEGSRAYWEQASKGLNTRSIQPSSSPSVRHSVQVVPNDQSPLTSSSRATSSSLLHRRKHSSLPPLKTPSRPSSSTASLPKSPSATGSTPRDIVFHPSYDMTW